MENNKTQKIPEVFLVHSCEVLGDTEFGLSGSKIAKLLSAYAVTFNVSIPHNKYPFIAPNKRTALFENLNCFSSEQQYHILVDLCDEETQCNRDDVNSLAQMLKQRYGMLDKESLSFDRALSSDTSHWLSNYPDVRKCYESAIDKRRQFIYERNLLDDLRLSLELLLKAVLNNNKSLENQISNLGHFVDSIGGSKEFTNMFVKLVDYFSKYQNEHIKHDDKVVELEIDFIVDITSAFMKSICRCV